MTHTPEVPQFGHEDDPDYDPRIAEFLLSKHPERNISTTGVSIMSRQLGSLTRRYGNPELDSYRSYHNDIHSFDGVGRVFWFLSIASKIPGLKIEDMDFELGGLAFMFHDDELEDADGMSAEQRSANHLTEVMRANGYMEEDITRAENAVMATEVSIEDGKIFQINVKKAATDPVVVAVAFADLAAIVMEGGQRMLQDVMNLSLEESGNVFSKDIFGKLLETQHSFVTKQVADMSDNIDALCKGNKEAAKKLKEAILEHVRTNYLEALDVAEKLKDNITDISDSVTSEFKKPVQQIGEQRQKIHMGILRVLRKVYWRSSTE